MRILLAACGSAHLRPIARALQDLDALAGLWITDKNNTGVSPDLYRRDWLYHLAMKPFYHLTPLGVREKVSLKMFPLWDFWVRHQKPPRFDVVYSVMGHAREVFGLAERVGALKVIDATNSHPTSAYGFWQRECDLWCPGARPGFPRWIFARSNRELERADVIHCPSKFVYDSMIYNGILASKCFINPYGVDKGSFTPRTSLPARPQFVCVGTICLRKGHQYLFRAFEKVKMVLPDAELVCVGPYYPDFRKERPRWEGTFRHYCNIPTAQLAAILRESTAFVFPSNEEGFAKALAEAMGSALPIVATHESGATTLVDDGVEGLIVKARHVEEIAAAMIRVATDREMNERMGRAAYARGGQNNSWRDFAQRIIHICSDALARRTVPGRNATAAALTRCRAVDEGNRT